MYFHHFIVIMAVVIGVGQEKHELDQELGTSHQGVRENLELEEPGKHQQESLKLEEPGKY